MSYSYQAFVMLPTENPPSLDLVKQHIHQRVDGANPPARIAIESDYITITVEDWQLRIAANCAPDVLVEAQEIAAKHLEPEDPKRTMLATYGFRLEISCDEDPNMDYFNYYIYALEALSGFPGAIVFDPSTTGFIE
jgi:phosphoribosylaminoimidazole carboxylase (NCAIR synthetase)